METVQVPDDYLHVGTISNIGSKNANKDNNIYCDIKENGTESKMSGRQVNGPPVLLVVAVVGVVLALVFAAVQMWYMSTLVQLVNNQSDKIDKLTTPVCTPKKDEAIPTDCNSSSVLRSGPTTINVAGEGRDPEYRTVYCDLSSPGNAWTVLLRRQDGSVDFDKDWDSYKLGFGNLPGEFYAGNDLMNKLTSRPNVTYRLRVDLTSYDKESRFAEYDSFKVESENANYQLNLGTYSGTAGDSLNVHRYQRFTTPDKDNDNYIANCAFVYHAGWWFNTCHQALLTGLYGYNISEDNGWQGIIWSDFTGQDKLQFIEMKIKLSNS